MNFILNDFLITPNSTIFDAFKKLDYTDRGFLIIATEGVPEGYITEKILRQAILRKQELTTPVIEYMLGDLITCESGENFITIIESFKKSKNKFIAITKNSKIVNIITKSQMHTLLLLNSRPCTNDDFLNASEVLFDDEIYPRPWGFYKTTVLNDFYQSKIINVDPKGQLSLQLHNHREEYWTIIRGEGEVQIGESIINVRGGSFVFVPKGCKHRITNTSDKESLIITEVQIGDYFGEDDIVRLEDKYGRD